MDIILLICFILIVMILFLIKKRFEKIIKQSQNLPNSKLNQEHFVSEKCKCKYCQGIYTAKKRLGYGGYGISYLCQNHYTHKFYVLKSIPVRTINKANEALNEVYFLQRLSHPNIVHYEEFFLHQDPHRRYSDLFKVIIIMEYCNGGDLYTLIQHTYKDHCPYTDEQILHFLLQLYHALWYIHQYDVVHRDIKPDNIFIQQDQSIRLGDFGLARVIHSQHLHKGINLSVTGTQLYRAPEMDHRCSYDKSSDVWSLGIVTMELINWKCYELSGKESFDYTQSWVDYEISHLNTSFSYLSVFQPILREMLSIDPHQRVSMNQIFSEPFFQEHFDFINEYNK